LFVSVLQFKVKQEVVAMRVLSPGGGKETLHESFLFLAVGKRGPQTKE